MPRTIEIGLVLPVTGDYARPAIHAAVETLARANVAYLRDNPNTSPLAKAGVAYERESVALTERWQTIPEVLARGVGDCEDLAAWRIAELRIRGIRAYPHVIGKNGKWHIQVKVISNNKQSIQDPSKELGM